MFKYYNKYLKYKNKYLQLKNQIGGEFTEADLTHNNIYLQFQVPTSLTDRVFSFNLFTNPVMTSDGQTYEQTHIERWFREGNNTSPISRQVLHDKTLIPNLTLKNIIKEIVNKEFTSNDSSYIYVKVTHNGITFTIKLPSSFLNKNIINYNLEQQECFYDFYNDPVVASDGYTYERDYIRRWLEIFDISPKTRKKLENKNLITNYALKNAITEIIEKEFSNYDHTFTLVTKRQKKCKNINNDDDYHFKIEHIFWFLENLPDDKKNDVIKNNLSFYDLINTYTMHCHYNMIFSKQNERGEEIFYTPTTLPILENFLHKEHRDKFIIVLNKLESIDAENKLLLEREKTLMNRSQEYDTDGKQQKLRKHFRKSHITQKTR
jgi:hypothetical protein